MKVWCRKQALKIALTLWLKKRYGVGWHVKTMISRGGLTSERFAGWPAALCKRRTFGC
jgi:hypothetical protein